MMGGRRFGRERHNLTEVAQLWLVGAEGAKVSCRLRLNAATRGLPQLAGTT